MRLPSGNHRGDPELDSNAVSCMGFEPSPSQTQISLPSAFGTTRGACPRNPGRNRVRKRSGGSTMWVSAESAHQDRSLVPTIAQSPITPLPASSAMAAAGYPSSARTSPECSPSIGGRRYGRDAGSPSSRKR